jgi:hypothetical protein
VTADLCALVAYETLRPMLVVAVAAAATTALVRAI